MNSNKPHGGVNLPDLSGAVAGERLLERSPVARVIILTSLAQLAPRAHSFGAFAWLNNCTPGRSSRPFAAPTRCPARRAALVKRVLEWEQQNAQ